MIDYKESRRTAANSKKNIIKNLGVILFFIITICAAYMLIHLYGTYKKKYNVLHYVIVKGDTVLSSQQIRYLTSANRSTSMDKYQEKDMYSKLILNPWIQKAYIAKIYPDTIYIKIIEQIPYAYIQLKNKIFIINGNGRLIDEYRHRFNVKLSLLPHIVIKNPQYLKKSFLIKSIIKIYEKLDKLNKINYIEVISDSYQLVHFSNSLNIAVDSLNCPEKAFEHLNKEWNNLVGKKDQLDSVSICFSNKFVLRWKKEKKGGRRK